MQPNQAPSGLSLLAGWLAGRRGLLNPIPLLFLKAGLIITHANMVHRDRRDHGIEHTNWLMSRFKSLLFKLENKHAVKGQKKAAAGKESAAAVLDSWIVYST